jgi:hypothetical protein
MAFVGGAPGGSATIWNMDTFLGLLWLSSVFAAVSIPAGFVNELIAKRRVPWRVALVAILAELAAVAAVIELPPLFVREL